MRLEKDPSTGEVIWPVEVLKQARQSVIDSKYAPGAEDMIGSGQCDHWHAVKVACYAISGHVDEQPEQAIDKIDPRDRKLDLDDRIRLIEQQLNEQMEERKRDMAERASFVQRTMDARMKRLLG